MAQRGEMTATPLPAYQQARTDWRICKVGCSDSGNLIGLAGYSEYARVPKLYGLAGHSVGCYACQCRLLRNA